MRIEVSPICRWLECDKEIASSSQDLGLIKKLLGEEAQIVPNPSHKTSLTRNELFSSFFLQIFVDFKLVIYINLSSNLKFHRREEEKPRKFTVSARKQETQRLTHFNSNFLI
jgi:hypothetical protein